MRNSKKIISFILSIVMVIGCIVFAEPQVTEASTKKVATAYDGDWTYFSYTSTIYKINSKNGKVVKVKDLGFYVEDITYYKGYLYFYANISTTYNSSEDYICRMKENGSDYKKLSKGHTFQIYNDRIYYVKTKNIVVDKYENLKRDIDISVSSMDLKGKNEKTIVKLSNATCENLVITDGKLYYALYLSSSNRYKLVEYNIGSKKRNNIKVVSSKSGEIKLLGADSNYVYFLDECKEEDEYGNTYGYDLYVYNTKSKKYEIANCSINNVCAVQGTKVYYTYDESLYSFDIKSENDKLIKRNIDPRNIIFSKSGYNIYLNYMTSKQQEACNYKYNFEICRMKSDGKGYKSLFKYFAS